ncbi:MAG: hypothetical protein HYX78_14250 [Armatimonadetes bacterium]|nr:hypothetical protein [Armatimonadota bacterium]
MRLAACISVALIAAICAVPATADRIIFAPTGNVLGLGEIKAEGAFSPSNDDAKVYWLNVGLPRLELSGIRFENGGSLVGADNENVAGVELAVLPETPITPGIGVGVWDITDETIEGRGYYLAVSKGIPLTRQLPLPLSDIRLHVGFGLSGVDTLFGGVEGNIPLGLRLSAEYFQDDFNLALGLRALPAVQLKLYFLDGDTYYGVQISPSF